MPEFRPFAALRPRPDLAGRICELPYDAVSSEEARARAAADRHSFFHVSRPDTGFPPGTDPYSDPVYERGRQYLDRFVVEGALVRDAKPCFHVYRQVMGSHCQTGIVGVASCAEYLAGSIRKHELTRADKEEDRVRHIETLNAQTGPVFVAFLADPDLERLVAQITRGPAAVDFTAPDGVRHTAWIAGDDADIEQIESSFYRMPTLYIADGHHRSAAAARVHLARQGRGGSSHFLAVAFPHDQLQVLPYQRVLRDLNGQTPAALERRLESVFEPAAGAPDRPSARHEVSLYLGGRWRKLRFRSTYTANPDPVERLDVDLLQQHVLTPIFGIADTRTSERIGFVGGIRGIGELERRVDGGQNACAFALYPTSIDDLIAVADRGGIMPPKSTWFEPKLRDGMFCHLLGLCNRADG